MATRQTFPQALINTRPDRLPAVVTAVPKPLHIPIFFLFAARGPVNVPMWDGAEGHIARYGAATFAERSPYYLHPNVFAKTAMGMQGVYIVRLAPDDAATGSLVLECTVTPKEITQYQKTVDGRRVLDSSGNPIPLKEADNVTIVTEPGVELSWSVRALTGAETLKTVAVKTVTNEGVTSTTYPVLVTQADSPGAFINNIGYRLYSTRERDDGAVAATNAMTYRFEPVQKDALNGKVTPIRSVWNAPFADVALKADALDPTTDAYHSINDVIARNYAEAAFPFKVHAYDASIKAIGEAILAVSPELDDLNPYRVNLLAAEDEAGLPYDHCELTAGSAAVINPDVTLFHRGGADGTLTKAELEALTSAYLGGDVYPEIRDLMRYPISHIYDSGYAMQGKKDLMKIFALRDDTKVVLSTQDVANNWNDKAEDYSTAASLRTEALLHPESVIEGTPVCRVDIFTQCGYQAGATSYRPTIPATINSLIKRCLYDGTETQRGEPKGRPNSEVSFFSEINWSPSAADEKQRMWDIGANYMQYCDTDVLHYADVRSVYPFDTSLLSDSIYVDRLVYLKRIVRLQWSYFVGRSDPIATQFSAIEKAIDKATNYAFGGRLQTRTLAYQTELDAALGYQSTVEVTAPGTMPNRVWQVIIPVTRAE